MRREKGESPRKASFLPTLLHSQLLPLTVSGGRRKHLDGPPGPTAALPVPEIQLE